MQEVCKEKRKEIKNESWEPKKKKKICASKDSLVLLFIGSENDHKMSKNFP